jgi:meiotic recombination protein SPO11
MSSSSSKRRRTRPDDVPPEGAADDTPVAAATETPGTPVAEAVETVGSKKRVVVQRAKDADIVLAQCRKLHAELIAKAAATDNAVARAIPDGIPSNIVEVAELPEAQVLEGMEVIALQVAHQVLSKKGFSMEVPSRAASNQVYVKEWDRIVLGGKRSSRTFLNVKEARKSAITLRVMQLLHAVLLKRIHITKRDLFYTDVKLFVDQADSDGVLDDVATIIGCTRSNLHVVASDKGLVVGRIQFEEDGDYIDCTKMGVGGKAIPPYIDKIENITSDAEFILLVEKEAAYMRMAVSPVGSWIFVPFESYISNSCRFCFFFLQEDRFYNRYPCIVMTAKGQPDVATRMFLSRVTSELHIPVLGLVDSDPYGLKILSVYMSGSKNMSYDSASLTTPDIKWLGLRPSDLDRYDLPDQCRLDMTENDIKTGKELLKEEFIMKNPAWVKEIEIMVRDSTEDSLLKYFRRSLTHSLARICRCTFFL